MSGGPPAPGTPSWSVLGSASPPSTRDGCLTGTLRILHPGADNPLHTSCVRVGAAIVITLTGRGAYRWTPVTSSDSAVVATVTNRSGPDGTTVNTLRAQHSGTTTLSSVDTFTPDPHGPPSHAWQLIVRVTP